MSAQMTAPFSKVYGEDEVKLAPKLDAPESDSKFQSFMNKLVSSLQQSDMNSRSDSNRNAGRDPGAELDGLDAMGMFAGRQMKDSTETVVKHQTNVVAGAGVAAAASAPNQHAAREMNALLKTEQNAKPIDAPKNTNQFAGNAEKASQSAENKGVQAQQAADKLQTKAADLATKMNPQQLADIQPRAGGVAGPLAEASLHAINPKVGIVATAAAAVASVVSTGQGQGTYSTEKTDSKPILSKSEQRAAAKAPTYYYDQAPKAIAAPAQATNTAQLFDKMGKGPGFDMGRLVSQESLEGLKVGNMKQVIEDCPAMKSIKSAGQDADRTKVALLDMKSKGLVGDNGKQTVKEELQLMTPDQKPKAVARPVMSI